LLLRDGPRVGANPSPDVCERSRAEREDFQFDLPWAQRLTKRRRVATFGVTKWSELECFVMHF
jgi:hypothetical protein